MVTIHSHPWMIGMTAQISVAEAKAKFAALVAKAEAGEDVIVTRNGRPVALLSAIGKTAIRYDDLKDVHVADDLSLPPDILVDFEPHL